MRKVFIIVVLFFCTNAFAQVEKVIPAKPNPPKLVNDFTAGHNFLTEPQAQDLEKTLLDYEDSTSTQITIVVTESLQGYSANEFATALGRQWGVGGKEFSNGIVILISTGEKDGQRNAYIATGYGMEGVVPDVIANDIVENDIVPNFKEGNYYRGFSKAIASIQKAAAGEYKSSGRKKARTKGSPIQAILIILFLIIYFILKSKGGGGPFVTNRRYGGFIGGGYGGFGGFSGGSSGSGGGFGGFGGGSFGGGGAGGNW